MPDKEWEVRQDAIDKKWGKITKDNIDDFLNWIVEEVYNDQKEEDLEYVRNDPDPVSYHFGVGLTIRNAYIYQRDYSEYGEIRPEPDNLSAIILERLMHKILGEEFEMIRHLYPDLISNEFLELRRDYKKAYGEYPIGIEKKYVEKSRDQSLNRRENLEEELLSELRDAIHQKGDIEDL